jgi:hypothetical protein
MFRNQLEEARDRLELKQQELEDCRTIMRRSEAEKARLEAKVIQQNISNLYRILPVPVSIKPEMCHSDF